MSFSSLACSSSRLWESTRSISSAFPLSAVRRGHYPKLTDACLLLVVHDIVIALAVKTVIDARFVVGHDLAGGTSSPRGTIRIKGSVRSRCSARIAA